MTLSIRPAVVDDADALGAVHMQCWRETYSRLLSPGFFDSRTPEQSAERWRRTLQKEPGEAISVAVVDRNVVGFAMSGPSRDDEPVRDLELYAIYVLAAHHGSGVGRRLLVAAVGDAPASLWMAKDNPRALAFYRRNGFIPDGTEKLEAGWENLEEIRLTR